MVTAPVVTSEKGHAEASFVKRQCAEFMNTIAANSDAGGQDGTVDNGVNFCEDPGVDNSVRR